MPSTSSSSSSSESERPKSTRRKIQHPSDTSDSESDASGSGSDDSDQSDEEEEQQAEEEVPVLSHAEQRRRKRQQQKAEQVVDDEDAEKSSKDSKKTKVKNTAELAPSKVPKRQNSVWVGNLAFKTTPDALRQFFDGAGEITRIHMPVKLATAGPGGKGTVKENRGFAYVDFASPDAKTIAIALSENPLDGRRLLVKDGDDFTGRPSTSAQAGDDNDENKKDKLKGMTKTAQKILSAQKQPAGPTLFLGNLGFETTEQSIRQMLESHRIKGAVETEQKPGEKKDMWIRKIRVGTFEDSGKCKGWAFVDFTTTEHATAALTNPKNFFLDGRKLVVEYGSPDAVRRGGAGHRPENGKGKQRRQDDAESGPRRERVRPTRKRPAGAEEDAGGSTEAVERDQPPKRRRVEEGEAPARPARDRKEREGHSKVRAKPGAALANAKRETVSIVPSQGKKIVF